MIVHPTASACVGFVKFPTPRAPGANSVRALTWKEVDGICELFSALNSYDRTAVPSSVLKIEKDNFDPLTGKQRQLYCVAISAKRYALFVKDENSVPGLLKKKVNNKKDRWSQHGLGHLRCLCNKEKRICPAECLSMLGPDKLVGCP